ncbi:MAG: DUF3341 domain-containing protein [Myxococcota bacterium]|nr:DUF3341 domain-containing protein [Myxococcota bacterium]
MAELRGVYGIFRHQDDLIQAASQVNKRNYSDWDCFTPYPVHGLDDAMGLSRSWIPWVTLVAGLTGTVTAIVLQVVIMVYNWPMNFGGRPFLSFPDFVPIMFELTVLFGGLATWACVFVSQGMPTLNPTIIDPRVGDDRFALYIGASNEKFDLVEVRAYLTQLGADEVCEHFDKDADSTQRLIDGVERAATGGAS